MAIITSIVVVAFVTQQRHTRDNKRATDLVSLTEAFERHYAANGSYPLTCGFTTHSELSSCGSPAITSIYGGGYQPVTIEPSTSASSLVDELPELGDSFGDPSADNGEPPVNRIVGGSITTDSYFVLSADLLPNQTVSSSGSISFYADRSQSSTLSCSFSLQPNQIGSNATQPHRYVVGYYSESNSAWQFFVSPMRADVNDITWNTADCSADSTGDLKLLSSS